MASKKHVWTPGEQACMENYFQYKKENPKPRKNLIKLVKHVNMLNPVADEYSWEYIFFDKLLNDEQVDFLNKVKLRKEYTVEELAPIANKSIEETAKFCHELITIGILEYATDKATGIDYIKLPVFAPGAMENTAYTASILEKSPEIAPAFLNYILDLQKLIACFVPEGSALMRAIPVEAAIESNSKKVPTDQVSHWLDWAEETGCIAVGYCECRRLRRMVGEGTADLEGEWCISLGKLAANLVRVGKHRKLTREEAEKILKEAEDKGYVHQLSNVDGPEYSAFICNCAWDTCMALKTAWYTSSPNLSSSNYRASVQKENCVACGGCVEVCPQNAVKLGEKLCTKKHIRIKPHPIPGDQLFFFGKKVWETNDFLTNRDNVYLETGTAPCKVSCPAHIAVQGYLKLANEGRYDEALELIKKENPFPAVCGSVCHKYCEHTCTRGKIDKPVSIDEVKRFLALRDINKETRFIPEKYYKEGHKIAIIGAGPAGLSAAYYLAINGHQVTVFDKNKLPGGMMRYGMPNFRLEKNLVDAEIEVIKELGVEIKCGVEVGKDITIQQLREEGYKCFYLAIGCQGGRKLGVEGEDANGVLSGVEFLHSYNEEGYPLSGKVVVVGGGNVAMDVARAAKRAGGDVTMYCLEQRDEMPASVEEIEDAESEGITINNGWGPKSIATVDGKVIGITFKRCKAVKVDGKFNPQYDDTEIIGVDADYVITAIGQSIILGHLLEGTAVETRPNGGILADNWTYQTKEPDIFVGGDVFTGPRFAIDAIAAGKEAADSLHRYAHEGHSLTLGRVKRDNFKMIDKDNLAEINDYDHSERQYVNLDKAKLDSNNDPRIPFTEEQVKAETSRCLGCGRAIVDQGICIGCGLCTTRCKFDAIHLEAVKKPAYGPEYERLVGAVLKEEFSRIGRAVAKPFKGKKDLNK